MTHRIAEESKVALRNIRREVITELESMSGVSDDEKFHGKKEIQRITDEYMDKLEEILARKEREIMEE